MDSYCGNTEITVLCILVLSEHLSDDEEASENSCIKDAGGGLSGHRMRGCVDMARRGDGVGGGMEREGRGVVRELKIDYGVNVRVVVEEVYGLNLGEDWEDYVGVGEWGVESGVVTGPGIVEVEEPSAFVVVLATGLKELPYTMTSHRA
ncbi:hypothetical protein Tco_0742723 [Tanacetum coccineum]